MKVASTLPLFLLLVQHVACTHFFLPPQRPLEEERRVEMTWSEEGVADWPMHGMPTWPQQRNTNRLHQHGEEDPILETHGELFETNSDLFEAHGYPRRHHMAQHPYSGNFELPESRLGKRGGSTAIVPYKAGAQAAAKVGAAAKPAVKHLAAKVATGVAVAGASIATGVGIKKHVDTNKKKAGGGGGGGMRRRSVPLPGVGRTTKALMVAGTVGVGATGYAMGNRMGSLKGEAAGLKSSRQAGSVYKRSAPSDDSERLEARAVKVPRSTTIQAAVPTLGSAKITKPARAVNSKHVAVAAAAVGSAALAGAATKGSYEVGKAKGEAKGKAKTAGGEETPALAQGMHRRAWNAEDVRVYRRAPMKMPHKMAAVGLGGVALGAGGMHLHNKAKAAAGAPPGGDAGPPPA